jgi:hypothetical protein
MLWPFKEYKSPWIKVKRLIDVGYVDCRINLTNGISFIRRHYGYVEKDVLDEDNNPSKVSAKDAFEQLLICESPGHPFRFNNDGLNPTKWIVGILDTAEILSEGPYSVVVEVYERQE